VNRTLDGETQVQCAAEVDVVRSSGCGVRGLAVEGLRDAQHVCPLAIGTRT
jgi:hypothetical protein